MNCSYSLGCVFLGMGQAGHLLVMGRTVTTEALLLSASLSELAMVLLVVFLAPTTLIQ